MEILLMIFLKKKNDDGGLFWKWKRHGRMPLVWNMNSWVLKKKNLIWSVFENNDASDDFWKQMS